MENTYASSWKHAALQPKGFAANTRRFLRSVVLSASSSVNSSCKDRFLRLLYCHYVFDDQKERFEKVILALKRLGTFVDTDTCVSMLEGKREINGRYFHLSFDDGFRNVFTNAIPILQEQHVPAIIFVPSSLVDADRERASVYCLETNRYRGVIEMIKWEDLRHMVSSGFEVGSHTKTHARFSTISADPSLLQDELLGSKEKIEGKLGIECKYISWPYGRKSDADGVSLKMIQRYAYKACFGAFRGTVYPGKTNKYSIPRHHFEVEWPLSHIFYFARGNMEYAQLPRKEDGVVV